MKHFFAGVCLALLAATSFAAKAPAQAPLSADAFNAAADTPLLKSGSRGPAVARAQILLDLAWYSVGEIDGRFAANMQRMVQAYHAAGPFEKQPAEMAQKALLKAQNYESIEEALAERFHTSIAFLKLHFAIFRLGPIKQWWTGMPVNPYSVWRDGMP